MRLSALRLRPWRRPTHESGGWGQPAPARRSSLAYLVLAGGAALFMLAVIFLMWPGESDGTAPASSGVLSADEAKRAVAADSMVAARAMGQAARATGEADSDQVEAISPLLSGDCALRRADLADQSQRIDRFDLDAVARLNVRIGLFNTECADLTADNKAAASAVAGSTIGGKQQDQAASNAARGVARTPEKRAMARRTVGSMAGSKPAKQSAGGKQRSPANPKPESPEAPTDEENGWNPTVLSVQSLLGKLGYEPGPSDGLMGKRTAAAVSQFQKDNKLPVTGLVTLELLESILAAYPGSGAPPPAATDKAPAIGQAKRDKPVALARPASDGKLAPATTSATSPRVDSTSGDEAAAAPAAPAPTPVIARAPAAQLGQPATSLAVEGLQSLTAFERQTVEWVCASASTDNGDQAYQRCIDDQIAAARRTGKPNLATLTPFERGAVVRLCADERYGKGLSAYYACAQRHKASLASMQKKPNMSVLSSDVRAAVRRNCDGLQFTESLPVYYRCVDTQVAAARR